MRAKTKILAIGSSVALMALGSSMCAFAAQGGWVQDNGIWYYKDAQGENVTDTWEKSGDGWFYVGSDGAMRTDAWVDDTHYVDSTGRMVTNQWIKVDPETDGAPSSDGGWYFFDGSGKTVVDGWKTINGKKYYFDSDGTMKYGWFNDGDATYYLGNEDEGWTANGWLCLDFDKDNLPEEGDVSDIATGGGDTSKWFYFQSNGKAVKASGSSYTSKTINGSKYYFDENGVMLTGWVAMGSNSDADSSDPTGISSFKYFGGDDEGQMAKGWRYLTDHPEDSDDSESVHPATSSNLDNYGNADGSWYYFDNNGVPKHLDASATNLSQATSRINGQSYFFDEYGRMQSGLIGFEFADGTTGSAYFGSSDSDGKMKTDKTNGVVEDNGDKSTFFFETAGKNKGAGFSGDKKGYLYYNGKLVKADKGTTTQVFEVNDKFYLVNESGKIQNSNKAYKSDGDFAYEYSNGTIYQIDSNKQRLGEVTSGEALPEISYQNVYTLQ